MSAKLIKEGRNSILIPMKDLRKGQLAVVEDSASFYDKHIVMRSDDSFYDLTSSSGWDKYCTLRVRVLPPGTTVEITSKV